MPFLSRHYSKEEPFSKVLFYSVLIHYFFFFLLFGNPFLILPPDEKGPPQSDTKFSVNLLSFPKMEEEPQESSSHVLRPTKRLNEEALLEAGEIDEDEEGPVPNQTEEAPQFKTVLSEAVLEPLNSINPTPSSPSIPTKKVARRMPPSMTGPEDCMLKVVGMVCPGGEVECITAYKEFCATLPD